MFKNGKIVIDLAADFRIKDKDSLGKMVWNET